MVRLKQRYVLFDILYPPSDIDSVFSKSPQEAHLSLCQPSSSSINAKTLTQLIRKSLQDHYGDFGSGLAGISVSIKYFNNKTSCGILRCSRSSFQIVMAALTLINRIGSRDVIIRCTHTSGTIKKCEEFAIKKNKEIILMINSRDLTKGNDKFNTMEANFKEHPIDIEEKEDE